MPVYSVKVHGIQYWTTGDSVTSIDSYAFSGCTSLASITIPDSVTSIERRAFSDTAYYKDESNWENNVLYICKYLISANTTISDDYDIKSGTLGIADYAFSGCSSLTSVAIPTGITNISDHTFSYCSNLTSITIPISMTSIGDYAFYNCTSLSQINYGGNDTDWMKISISSDGNSQLYSAYGVDDYGECGSDLSWIIKDNTLTIGGTGDMYGYSNTSARYYTPWYDYRESITSAVIADGVTSIGKYAFYGCSNLISMTIPESITSIGNGAFVNCNSLESVYITDLAAWCGISFGNTTSNPLYYGGSLYINGELAQEITIPDGVTSIGNYAFYGYTALTSVTISESVASIGTAAFAGCGSINITAASDNPNYSSVDGVLFNKDQTEIVLYAKDVICPEYTIPDGVTNISSYAFYYCTGLTSITIPIGVTSIGTYAFYYCSGLTSVTLPSGMTSIDERAFAACSNLTDIRIPKSVTSIAAYAFSNCKKLVDVYYDGTWNDWNTVTIDSNNEYLTSATIHCAEDSGESKIYSGTCGDDLRWTLDPETGIFTISGTGAMTDYRYNTTPWYNYRSMITSIVIEDGVTSIGECVFFECENLTSITIPNTVTRIGDSAFYDCYCLCDLTLGNNITYIGDSAFSYGAFTSITIPDTVTYIGDSAFFYCDSLTSITIPDSVTYIGDYAFNDCEALASVTIGSGVTYIGSEAFSYTALTSVTIPDGITTICEGTFKSCKKLTTVTIPRSVTLIEESAFNGCTSLKDVYYGGSEMDWEGESIEIYDDNSYLLRATIHYGMADYTEETYYSIGKYEDAAEAEVIIDEDGEVTIDLIIIDETALSASNVTAYAVSYSGGTVESIDKLSKTITTDGATFTGSVSGTYKIFIWDENMQPITEKIE